MMTAATAKKPRILILCSDYYPILAKEHLEHAVTLLEGQDFKAKYDYIIEMLAAGTYEVPAAIQQFHNHQPFDAYMPLSLLLKGGTDHYEFIWEHVKECFIQFAMSGIVIGNGIISASTMDILTARVAGGERVIEALKAIDYLLGLKTQFTKHVL